jgi:hypothetical protein
MSTMHGIWEATKPGQGVGVSHVILAGDISYANSKIYRWADFFESMEPLFRSTPMAVAVGNHEVECNTDTLQVFVPYESWFHNPNYVKVRQSPITHKMKETFWNNDCNTPSKIQADYQHGNSYYSFDHGMLKTIVINSYVSCTWGSPQHNWLLRTLKRTDRTVTPWILVVAHSPVYSTFTGHQDELLDSKAAMESLFHRYGVNLVASGHDHAYMRTHPVYNRVRVPSQVDAHDPADAAAAAPIYVIVGTGGNWEGPPSDGYVSFRPEPWVAARHLTAAGYSTLSVVNATHAHWMWRANLDTPQMDWVRDKFIDEGTQASWQSRWRRFILGRDAGGDPHRDDVWLVNPHAIP